jgi:ABC-2 type transport system ATP-binding protein
MWAEIDRLAAAERLTILLTTHYLEEADHLANGLAIVDRGRIVAEGTPDELKGELRGDEAGRSAMSAHPDWARVDLQGGGLAVLALAVTALSVLMFRAYQKSV